MTDITELNRRLAVIESLLRELAQQTSTHRLDKNEMAERLGIHRNTLLIWTKNRKDFPQAGPDGKWAIADVIAWQKNEHHRRAA